MMIEVTIERIQSEESHFPGENSEFIIKGNRISNEYPIRKDVRVECRHIGDACVLTFVRNVWRESDAAAFLVQGWFSGAQRKWPAWGRSQDRPGLSCIASSKARRAGRALV
ncbi:hypothetical protein ACKI2N_004095 [Cupriavidus sp. 30B13]|uniref:hypothetical protein n=1 Tax=Cupriavidus sp. 30B13 TaxID=3384241 RepID=UPI003B913108